MTESWHDECRRLRAEGMPQHEIAEKLRQSPTTIRRFLNETPAQKFAMKRLRESKRKPRPYSERKDRANFYRKSTPVTVEITLEIKRAAILAFSKHEIDRGELMRRITPRDKWSAAGFLRVELVP